MTSLKGQVNQVFTSSTEHELNRTFTTKKASVSQPTSARVMSPSRIPLPVSARKATNDDTQAPHGNDGSFSRPLPSIPVARSKTFNNGSSQSSSSTTSDEGNLLRSYKIHFDQSARRDAPAYSDVKIPNYTSIEDVLKTNEV
jgi:hypothetical protein